MIRRTKVISIWVDDDLYEFIRDISTSEKISISSSAREMLIDWKRKYQSANVTKTEEIKS